MSDKLKVKPVNKIPPNARPILYTDTINGQQVCRDDMWAVTTHGLIGDREKLAQWMLSHGFATGHGDTIDDLIVELGCQIEELRRNTHDQQQEGVCSLDLQEKV